jgi:hypothetical protein
VQNTQDVPGSGIGPKDRHNGVASGKPTARRPGNSTHESLSCQQCERCQRRFLKRETGSLSCSQSRGMN